MFEYAPRYEYYLDDVEVPVPLSLFDTDKWGSEGTRGKNDSLRHFIGTSVSSRHEIRNYVMEYKCNTGDEMENTYLAYQHYLKSYLRCVKGVSKKILSATNRSDSARNINAKNSEIIRLGR